MTAKNRTELVCLNCGKIFEEVSSRIMDRRPRFCSRKCQQEFSYTKSICLYCGKEFVITKFLLQCGSGKYCGQDCYKKQKAKKKSFCVKCGKEFTKPRKNQIFCSIECKREGREQVKRICSGCGKEFFASIFRVERNLANFCSTECYHKSRRGIPLSEEVKKQLSITRMGKNNPNYGKHPSEETRKKMSEGRMGPKNGHYGKIHSEEAKRKMSLAHQGQYDGEKNPQWKGGISFLPYCPKFNEKLKEQIRDIFNRKCFLCGKTEKKNGAKLDVHHVNFSKSQGCFGEKWNLIALCHKDHTFTTVYRFYAFCLLGNYWAMNEDINFNYQEGDIYWKRSSC